MPPDVIMMVRRVEVLKPAISSQGSAENAEPNEVEATKVSGYIESPIAKMCGTCEYLEGTRFCNNKTVLTDKELPDADSKDLKIIDPVLGCCNLWSPDYELESDEQQTE